MRVLCLNFHQAQEPSCAEVFHRFSPRSHFRYPHFLFLEIEGTSPLWGGDAKLMRQAVDLARTFAPQTTAAVATSAPVAQALMEYFPFEVTGDTDHSLIEQLPLSSLREFEGLEAWDKTRKVDHIIAFFQDMGFQNIGEILDFQLSSFRERWGTLGVTLWKRIHGRDIQVISPFIPQEPLQGYHYYDDATGRVDQLVDSVDSQLKYLFLRLEGRGKFAQYLDVIFHCEYSDDKHHVRIEPVSPSRDLNLFLDLLKKKLESMSFTNPIRELEILVQEQPEKVQQLDFFQPQDTSEDRWRRLISFARQSKVEMGFLQEQASHFPEKSYSLKTDWPEDLNNKDVVEYMDQALQVKSVYAKGLPKSPRPSLFLRDPLPLSGNAMSRLRLFSKFPVERIESSWWETLKGNQKSRDYYFALSNDGELCWIYQDCSSKQYYLHGYFD